MAASLQPFVDNHSLAGAVMLVADKNGTLAVETVGYSDVAAKTPIGPDALFWIASMSKPMTATAVMMLVDEGKLRLDDAVEKYLPEFKGQMVAGGDGGHARAPSHPITLRNVLSHTSGLPFRSPSEEPTLDAAPLADRVESYAKLPLDFDPESKFQYSNAGINTAARVLEVVGRMPYEDFMEQRLFKPLGLKDTTFWPSKEQLCRLAKSYKPNAQKNDLEETTITQLRYPLDDRERRYPVPAGGLFSTAADAGRFCRMILNGGQLDGNRYVSEEAIRQMGTKQTAPTIQNPYGLGWATGNGWFGHGGAYATNMTVDIRQNLILVFMVQHAGFPGDGRRSQGVFMDTARQTLGK